MTPYARVMRAPGSVPWLLVTILSRLAVASVPLGSVFLAKHYLDSYAIGALLAGAYAAGEALAAPRMGSRFHSRSLHAELRMALGCEAVLLALTTVAVQAEFVAVAVALVAAAGAVASGAPGALRTVASSLVPEHASTALGLDSAVSQAMFMTGPALAAVVATTVGPGWFLSGVGVALLLALPTLARVPDTFTDDVPSELSVPLRELLPTMLPGVVASIAVMALVATLDTTLPGQLEALELPRGLAGPLLATLAGSSIVASLVYGLRSGGSNPADQAMVASLAFAAAVACISFATNVFPLLVLIAIAGVCQAPALTARNLSVSRTITRPNQPAAFSILYASGGVGYTISSIYVAATLDYLGPSRTQTTLAIAAALLIGIVWVVERRRRSPEITNQDG